MRIIFSGYALMQLEKIYHYLQTQNVNAAAYIHNSILDEIEKLKDFPQMAVVESQLSGLPHTYRSLIVKRTYKVVYYVKKEIIHIAAIFDCRQNPRKLRCMI